MKRLSIRSLVLLLAMFMIAGAWSPARSIKAAPKAKAFYTPYYFFYQPYDECIGYQSTQETEAWFLEYDGVLVDTNPSNGTLIATGYMDGVYPHDLLPTVYLYMH